MSSTEAVLLMCFSIGFRKIATPYGWHVQESCLFVSVFEKEPSCSLPSFWGRGRQRQQQEITPGYASAFWFKQTMGARGCAEPW